jgi:hypothetical protein
MDARDVFQQNNSNASTDILPSNLSEIVTGWVMNIWRNQARSSIITASYVYSLFIFCPQPPARAVAARRRSRYMSFKEAFRSTHNPLKYGRELFYRKDLNNDFASSLYFIKANIYYSIYRICEENAIPGRSAGYCVSPCDLSTRQQGNKHTLCTYITVESK